MSSMANEVEICKSTSVKLNDDTLFILAYVLHTADKEMKKSGDKSFYRYEGRVVKIADLETEIANFKDDSVSQQPWKWGNPIADWNKDWFVSHNHDQRNAAAAKWFSKKLKAHISWEDFLKLANEGIKKTAKGFRQSECSKLDLVGYETSDGEKFDITSPEELLKHVGKWFSKRVVLKRDLPKT